MLKKHFFTVLACLLILSSPAFAATCYKGTCVVDSIDKTPISYSIYGQGDVTLVFIHGWSCDSRYWKEQIPFFSRRYKVITLDLAGHGHSGTHRQDYTMKSFGEDIKSVVEAQNVKRAILIGHSMGGEIAAQAAILMPEKIAGIIGIDTLQDVGYILSQEDFEKMIEPLNADFRKGASDFVKSMFLENANQRLADWIVADMSSAPADVALSAFQSMLTDYSIGDVAKLFDGISTPVACINARLWPTDEKSNRKHIKSYSASYMDGVGHFLMMEKPHKFNKLLDETIKKILKKK